MGETFGHDQARHALWPENILPRAQGCAWRESGAKLTVSTCQVPRGIVDFQRRSLNALGLRPQRGGPSFSDFFATRLFQGSPRVVDILIKSMHSVFED